MCDLEEFFALFLFELDLARLMGQKSLVNRSFPFKKNLTTEVNPYIANGCRLVKGSKVQGSKVPRFDDNPRRATFAPKQIEYSRVENRNLRAEASDLNRNTGLNPEPFNP
jgi:hypothetical protein